MDSTQPPPATIWPLLIVALILILLSMLFSASETAYFSINKLRIRYLRSQKNKNAMRAGKLLDNKEKLLNTILVANDIVNISLTTLLTSITYKIWGNSGVALATGVSTILLLIFGEITPKSLGTRHPEAIAFKTALLLEILETVLKPFVFVFTLISRFSVSIFGIKLHHTKTSFSQEEIKTFLEVGQEEGILESGESQMMHRVFTFTDLEAKDILVPRTEIISVSSNTTYKQVIELSQKSRISRFPVLGKDNNIDDIQGVLYMKDVLLFSGMPNDFSVKKVMRPPLFILETKKMSTIQQVLRQKSHTIAIILDEYSGTSGLLTKEDITREIFGSMGDEYDTLHDPQQTSVKASNGYIGGNTRLIDISEALSLTITSKYYETIAGYIMEQLGHVPAINDCVIIQNWSFTVKEISGHRVKQIYIKDISK